MQRVLFQEALLIAVKIMVLADVARRRDQKSAGSRRGVNDGLVRCWTHNLDDAVDQDARREVLAGAGFRILRVFFEQAFIKIAFDVDAEDEPILFVDQLDDEAAQQRGTLDLVLGLEENRAEHARLFTEIVEHLAVMVLERNAIELEKAGTVIFRPNEGAAIVGWLRLLMRHSGLPFIRPFMDSAQPEAVG